MAVKLSGIELSGAAIGHSRKSGPTHAASPASQDTAAQSGDTQSADQGGTVSITSTAALLAHLEQALGAQPAVDQKRVDQVSQALAAGTYKVEPDKIANGLIQSERTLAQLPEA